MKSHASRSHRLGTMLIVSLSLVVLVLVAGPESQAMSRHAIDGPHLWTGTIELPGGSGNLDFSIALTLDKESSEWSGTIDIPAQGAMGLALQDIEITETTAKFTLAPPGAPEIAWAKFELTLDETGNAGEGVLKQAGMEMPTTIARSSVEEIEAARPKRPQTPQPPFPYEAREVSYTNDEAGITLTGTLTIPEGTGPHPAVVLITGSGAQDRDETIFEHKPFAVIADHLSRNGIAVLRADDRGVGGSGGNIGDSSSLEFAGDVRAGLSFLKTVKEIDAAHLGLVGHSEGGIIAPIVASSDDRVAFIVLLAGTGLPGHEILTLQMERALIGNGVDPQQVGDHVELQRDLLRVVMDENASDDDIRAALRKLMQHEREMAGQTDLDIADEALETVINTQVAQMKSKWFQSFLPLDPREYLRNVTCPVLALNGVLDFQVPSKENLPAIRKALEEAGNNDVSIHELPGLNHMFQHATTGMLAEYAQIEETFAPEALAIMTDWIRGRAGLGSDR